MITMGGEMTKPTIGADVGSVISLTYSMMRYGQFERALRLLDLADWLSPKHPDVINLRILALTQMNRWDEALSMLLTKQRLDKADYRGLADIYWNLGDDVSGADYFNRTVSPH